MIFDRIMLADIDEQGDVGLLEPISIVFLLREDIILSFGGAAGSFAGGCVIFDRIMLAYMDEQVEMGLLEPISILFLSKQEIVLAFGGHL